MENKAFNKNFNSGIKFVSRCPLCNAQYDSDKAEIIEEKNGTVLIYIECSKCKSSIIANVAIGGLGIVSLGLVTDMTREDARKFKKAKTISADDMLTLYQQVRENEKNFLSELNKGKTK